MTHYDLLRDIKLCTTAQTLQPQLHNLNLAQVYHKYANGEKSKANIEFCE